MSRINKKLAQHIVHLQNESVPHLVDLILRKQAKSPSLPKHFDKSVDYYKGCLDSLYTQIESLLFMHNVYYGYRESVVRGASIRRYVFPDECTNVVSVSELKRKCTDKYISSSLIEAERSAKDYQPEHNLDYTIYQAEEVIPTTCRPYIRLKTKSGSYAYLMTKTKTVTKALLEGAELNFVAYTPDGVAVYDLQNQHAFHNVISAGDEFENYFILHRPDEVPA